MKFSLFTDLFTDPSGETWSIGRIYSFPMLCTGLAVPILSLFRGQPVDMAATGALLAGTAGGVLLLVRGANNVDLTDPANPQLPTGDTTIVNIQKDSTP